MDQALKQRLIGAAIIIAVVVLVVPIFLEGPGERDGVRDIELPDTPELERESRLLPLSEDAPAEPEPVQREVQPRPRAGESVDRPVTEQEDTLIPEQPAPQPQPEQQPEAEPVEQEPVEPEEVEALPEPAAPEPQPEPETAAEPVPAPQSPAEREGSHAVQVGAFGSEDNAMGLRDRIREAGFPAYVELYSGGAQTVYRVRVGPAVDRRSAEGLAQRLGAEMGIDGQVVSHP